MTAPVCEFRSIKKSFSTPRGCVEVLRGVNLSISEGDFMAVTGPSGSGKSTFLHLSALLDRPSSGTLLFQGKDISALTEDDVCQIRKWKVGMVFQKYCLLPHRSALDNVIFRFRYLDCEHDENEERALKSLETMGLLHIANRPARLLSGGEMQRVAIARAIALQPELLVADEPTGNLDRANAISVMEGFASLNQQGITILLVTHNEELLDFSTRHMVCRDGRIESE